MITVVLYVYLHKCILITIHLFYKIRSQIYKVFSRKVNCVLYIIQRAKYTAVS